MLCQMYELTELQEHQLLLIPENLINRQYLIVLYIVILLELNQDKYKNLKEQMEHHSKLLQKGRWQELCLGYKHVSAHR